MLPPGSQSKPHPCFTLIHCTIKETSDDCLKYKEKTHTSRPFSSCSEVTSFSPPLHRTFLWGEKKWYGSCSRKPSHLLLLCFSQVPPCSALLAADCGPLGTSTLLCHSNSCSRIVSSLTHSSCGNGNATPCSGTALVAAAPPSGLFPPFYQFSQEGIVPSMWKALTVMAWSTEC